MKTLLFGGLLTVAMLFAPTAQADPYCFVPLGQYKNTCDPDYLIPQTSPHNGIPGTWGPDGQYTPCTTRYCR